MKVDLLDPGVEPKDEELDWLTMQVAQSVSRKAIVRDEYIDSNLVEQIKQVAQQLVVYQQTREPALCNAIIDACSEIERQVVLDGEGRLRVKRVMRWLCESLP